MTTDSRIIISHDVDHLSPMEHYRDLIVPKFVARAFLERYKNHIDTRELAERLLDIPRLRWNFVRELADYDRQQGIRSHFFFGVNKGLGLVYEAHRAGKYIDYIEKAGHIAGIHGIARDTLENIRAEREKFEQVHKRRCIGIRMHYLYPDEKILPLLEQAGYRYDSSLRGDGSVRQMGHLVHFPLHVMDGDILMRPGTRYQSVSLEEALQTTRERLSRLIDGKTDYISLLFHDRYFSPAHSRWQDWYMGMIEWINSQHIATTDYETALDELSCTR